MAEQTRQRPDRRLALKLIFGVLVAAFVWSPFIAMTWKLSSRNRMVAPAPVPPFNLSAPRQP
ncbi:hypothetical protein [Cyanobium sp. ATX 6F1]|uniref:hypothetical protein n=1 Tax=unclassified Cyanobium TaxID=2627006 RepID=UPI0020CE6A1A|nr:hypothetical protein [Cyanobium sp. ATX 6F1]MCP9914891.1 hypothetical protein [Cyanobium sp. ATX 6F1]